MTAEQMEKSQWFDRLYYAKLRVSSLYSLKEKDEKGSKEFFENMPESSDTMLTEECRKITEAIRKKSAEKYIEALREYENIRNEIEAAIESIDNYEYQAVLSARYIEGKTWDIIAEEMFYSLRTVKYKHLKALDFLKAIPHKD